MSVTITRGIFQRLLETMERYGGEMEFVLVPSHRGPQFLLRIRLSSSKKELIFSKIKEEPIGTVSLGPVTDESRDGLLHEVTFEPVGKGSEWDLQWAFAYLQKELTDLEDDAENAQ
ncbi:MAG: hypothetical protein RMK62_10345 [Armatimonadota bacterium]|nr:hypothetical protein [Armatimonadota bacterium]